MKNYLIASLVLAVLIALFIALPSDTKVDAWNDCMNSQIKDNPKATNTDLMNNCQYILD